MSSSKVEIPAVFAQQVKLTDDTLSVDLSDGRTIAVPLAWYPRLVDATPKERNTWRLIAGGGGIHSPPPDPRAANGYDPRPRRPRPRHGKHDPLYQKRPRPHRLRGRRPGRRRRAHARRPVHGRTPPPARRPRPGENLARRHPVEDHRP